MSRTDCSLKSLLSLALLGIAGGVHAGATLDLTSAGSFGGFVDDTAGAVVYRQTSLQPTGTGYIDPFVRIGMQGSAGKDVVSAYNTIENGVLNNSNEDNWNHAVTYGQMNPQGTGSNAFFRFLLDINQTGSSPRLNLDDVQIFISTVANQKTTDFSADGQLLLASATQVYRMDAPGTSKPPASCSGPSDCGAIADDGSNRVSLDFSLGSGSGSGDMYLDIPVSLFTSAFSSAGISNGAKAGTFVYLYSKFGSDPFNNNDGFEEWAFLAKVAPPGGGGFSGGVPEPASLALVGLGLLAVVGARRRERTAAQRAR